MRRRLLLLASIFAALSPAQTGIDPKSLDTSVKPCDNFYQYACGSWRKSNPLPDDQSRWSRFSELSERNRKVLRELAEKLQDPTQQHTDSDKKVADFYASRMDEAGIEKKGLSPVLPELDQITSLKDKAELGHLVARMHLSGVPAFFNANAAPDAKNSTQVILNVVQGGLSLPDRDYYLRTDPKSIETRQKYGAHVRSMFELLGHMSERAKSEADAVLKIETALAKSSLDRVTLRDPNQRYHKVPVSELNTQVPDFDWKAYLTDLSVSAGKLDGYTPEQRLFLAFAQVWCENRTDESSRLSALTDPHSAGRFRTNGVLQNMPEFQQAWGCKVGDAMVSTNPCRVW